MIKHHIFIAVASVLLISCNANNGGDSEQHASETTIQLNNGEKWQVNAEMKPHIKKGNELLNSYVSGNGEDYQQLAADLKQQNDALIKSCSMKGESHDELHQWLHPHIELIEKLSNAENQKEAQETVSELEQSFELYHEYFE